MVANSIPKARHAYYADFPACLQRYRWIVEDAVRADDPDRLFNINRGAFTSQVGREINCKVCGDGRRDRAEEMREHMEEHAAQLGLKARLSGATPKAKLAVAPDAGMLDDAFQTIKGIIDEVYDDASENDDGMLVFTDGNEKLSKELASAIVGFVTEQTATEQALCADCES